jgi:hypothetical protein
MGLRCAARTYSLQKNLELLILTLQKYGVDNIFVVTIPWPQDIEAKGKVFDWERFHSNICANLHCVTIHTRDYLIQNKDVQGAISPLHLPSDPHLSEHGHLLVAQSIFFSQGGAQGN